MNELNAKIGGRGGWEKRAPEQPVASESARSRTLTDVTVCQVDTSLTDSGVMSRSAPTQPVTVNSLRGMHAGAFRQRAGDLTVDMRVARAARSHGMQKYSKSSQTLSSREAPRASPAVYDVRAARGQQQEAARQPMKSNPAHRGMLCAYSLPEVNSHHVEVHVPGEGKPKVPFRKPAQTEARPRPRPITDPEHIIARLERSSSSPDPMPRVTSPISLPPPPSPPSDTLAELDIANFSPPAPLSPATSPRPLSAPEMSPPTLSVSDLRTPSPHSNTVNKTLTPPSNERTFVGDVPEYGTPWPPHRGGVRTRIAGSGSDSTDNRRSVEDKDLVTMDPYVTYEDKDLRVTFVWPMLQEREGLGRGKGLLYCRERAWKIFFFNFRALFEVHSTWRMKLGYLFVFIRTFKEHTKYCKIYNKSFLSSVACYNLGLIDFDI